MLSGKLHFETGIIPADIFYIAVQTPINIIDNEPKSNLSYVYKAASMIATVIQENNLVVVESTIPLGTTSMVTDIISKESGLPKSSFYVVHTPERVILGHILNELRDNDRILGSNTEEGIEKAINFDRAKAICVFGLSYKANVDDLLNSPLLKLCHILLDRGYTIIGCEPHIHKRKIQGIKNFDIEEALGIADFGVITLSHDLFIKKKNIFKRILIYNCTELLF